MVVVGLYEIFETFTFTVYGLGTRGVNLISDVMETDSFTRPNGLYVNSTLLHDSGTPATLDSRIVNHSEVLVRQRYIELEDENAALKQQVSSLKSAYKMTSEEWDNATIDYAVVQAKLDELEYKYGELVNKTRCHDCRLKDGLLTNLEKEVENLKARLSEQLSKEKKRKRRASQAMYHHDSVLQSSTVTPVPARFSDVASPSLQMTRGFSRGIIKDDVLGSGALKQLLYKDDQLVEDLADSFEPTSIKGNAGSWIGLCSYLNINSANLFHIDHRKRLLDILKEHERSLDHDISIRELHGIFKVVGNENSACRLVQVAREQLPTIKYSCRSRHKTQHRSVSTHHRNDLLSLDVLDSDITSSSSEDCVPV